MLGLDGVDVVVFCVAWHDRFSNFWICFPALRWNCSLQHAPCRFVCVLFLRRIHIHSYEASQLFNVPVADEKADVPVANLPLAFTQPYKANTIANVHVTVTHSYNGLAVPDIRVAMVSNFMVALKSSHYAVHFMVALKSSHYAFHESNVGRYGIAF